MLSDPRMAADRSSVLGWVRSRGLQPELWVADSKPAALLLYARYGVAGRAVAKTVLLGLDVTGRVNAAVIADAFPGHER
jgi:hypothetical protein